MQLDITWDELAKAAGGRLVAGAGADPVGHLSTDTRKLQPGDCFWALKGQTHDAHDHLEQASRAGGWVVERGRATAKLPAHVVEVTDTTRALQALAAHHRRRFDIPVVGITGSNGKTTTKEMLKAICSRVGPTCATPGNWNNQIGVPLSILMLRPEHAYGVFELADSRPGDIDEVARVAQPTLGLITNIGPDHLEFYGSMESNFKTKCELIERLGPDARAVINVEDPWLAGLEPRLGPRAVTFGLSSRARVHWASKDELVLDGRKVKVKLKAFGDLSRYNAAAAAAAAWALGIDPENIRLGLEDYRPGNMRLEPMKAASGADVVFDAYNANPASMRSAISAFCEEHAGRRKLLVLGDMKELGSGSAEFHADLGRWLATLPLEGVFLAGPEMRAAADALKDARPPFKWEHAERPEGLAPAVAAELRAGAVLMLKASRSMRLEVLLQPLSITPCSTT